MCLKVDFGRKMEQFKTYLYWQCAVCLIGLAGLFVWDPKAFWSFFIGACLSTLNILGNYGVCWMLFKKVQGWRLGLTYFFKYLMIGGFIALTFVFWTNLEINVFWLICGILTFALSGLLTLGTSQLTSRGIS